MREALEEASRQHREACEQTAEAVNLSPADVDQIVTIYHYELMHSIEHWKEN